MIKKNFFVTAYGITHIYDARPEHRVRINDAETLLCEEFIRDMCGRAYRINRRYSSYDLKHDVERWHRSKRGSDVYVSNGAFIQAAINCGLDVSHCGSIDDPNCWFNITVDRKKMRALGVPGWTP